MKLDLLYLTVLKLLPGIPWVCNIQILESLYDLGDSGSLGREILVNTGCAAKNTQTHLILHGSTVESVVVLCFLAF